MDSFGERLKFLRANQSQSELAAALNIKQTTLSNYERCRNEPTFETLKKICSHFGVNTEWFMYGTGPMRSGDAPQDVPANAPLDTTGHCARCAILERVDAERRELSAENRRLWCENAALRERCAMLEERQRHLDPAGFFSKQQNASSNEPLIGG